MLIIKNQKVVKQFLKSFKETYNKYFKEKGFYKENKNGEKSVIVNYFSYLDVSLNNFFNENNTTYLIVKLDKKVLYSYYSDIQKEKDDSIIKQKIKKNELEFLTYINEIDEEDNKITEKEEDTENFCDLLLLIEEERKDLLNKIKKFFIELESKCCNKGLNFEKIVLTFYNTSLGCRYIYLTPTKLSIYSETDSLGYNTDKFDLKMLDELNFETLQNIVKNLKINLAKKYFKKTIEDKKILVDKLDILMNKI